MDSLCLIAAIGSNYELGKDNDLIWRFKDDMKFFRDNTIGKTIVMGRSTFLSLPGLLKNRNHIVLSKHNIDVPSVMVVHSRDELMSLLDTIDGEVMVIGGGSIYKLLIDDANKMLLTEIMAHDDDATVFFPRFNMDEWDREIIGSNSCNNIIFNHVKYTRKLQRK